jgi:hypothetical protein
MPALYVPSSRSTFDWMRQLLVVTATAGLLAMVSTVSTAAGPRDVLSRARQLYNAAKYDEAIEAAQMAGLAPDLAHSARLVLARAYLERFRQSGEPSDLSDARDALAQVRPAELEADDRVELTIALGESLYLDDKAGAAAEQFELALGYTDPKHPERRELTLDWWASSLDRQAQMVAGPEARTIEMRIVSRMDEELRRNPESVVASYWLVAGARGAGDVERAWAAAIAAWVRAAQAGRRGVTLQTDLNRVVVQAVIPERARQLGAGNPDTVAAAMRKEWESLKETWVAR